MNSFKPACSYGGRKSHRAVSALAYSVGATAPAYSNGQKSYGDDGFSSSVSLFEITDGLGDLATNTPPARRFFYNGPISKTVTFFLRETALLMLIAPFN